MLLRNRPGQVAAFLGVLLAGGTVVTINPSRGDERTRADIAALRLPADRRRARRSGDTGGAPERRLLSISGCLDEPGESVRPGSGPVAAPGVAVRMLTSGTTGPPKRIDLSYDMLARSVMGSGSRSRAAASRAAPRRRDRELTAGAHRRRLPGAAVRRRGEILCAAGTLRAQRVGRGGAQAPAARGVAGAGRIADGVALRPVASRPGQHPRRHLRHGPAVGRRRRRLHREVRHSRSNLLCCNRIRWRRGRLDPDRLPAVLDRQTRQRRAGQPRRAAAGGRRRRHAARAGPGRAAGGQAGTAGAISGVDADHGFGTHRRGRLSLDRRARRSGDHPRRVQGDARRRARRAGGPPRGSGRGCGRATRRSASARRRSPWWNCASPPPPIPTSCWSTCERDWLATRFPPRSRSSTRSREHRRARPT